MTTASISQRVVRKQRWGREHFMQFVDIPTRWDDNDALGHINNVKYYAFFDTAITRMEIAAGIFNTADSLIVPYVVESGCSYFEGLSFPDDIEVGVAVEHLGNTSISYRLGVFRKGAALAAAQGIFVHVYVDRQSNRPSTLPENVRAFARALSVS